MNKSKRYYTNVEGWLSIVVNILLFGLKLWAGIISSSAALIADAWHTLSDSISSVIVLISGWFSNKEPDKEHPFGHGRFELVASIFIGFLLLLIGISFIKEGITKFTEHQEAQFGTLAIIATIISIVGKEILAQYAFYAYRKTDSEALRADGWHHRSDALSSIVLLIGIFAGRYFWWIDSLLSIIISGFILYAAYEIIKRSISSILGEKASEKITKQVIQIANKTAGEDIIPHHIHAHNYVNHVELTMHVVLPSEKNVKEAHDIITNIEDKIKEELDIEATIHIDPLEHYLKEIKKERN